MGLAAHRHARVCACVWGAVRESERVREIMVEKLREAKNICEKGTRWKGMWDANLWSQDLFSLV